MTNSMTRFFANRRPAFGGAGIDTRAEGSFVASHYRYYRHKRGMTVTAALAAASALPAAYVAGREYYGDTAAWGAPYKRGSDTLRHCSDTAALGLRLVGDADDIASIDHTGWFTDDEMQDSKLRGAVWSLPGKRGVARLVYGYREFEGRGEMNEGSAIVCVSDIVRQPMTEEFGNVDETDGASDAAKWADSLAESAADDEREYRQAYNAGRDAAEADTAAIEAFNDLRALIVELRGLRGSRVVRSAIAGSAPNVIATLRSGVESALETIYDKRKARDTLWSDCPSVDEDAWKNGFMDTAIGNGFSRAVRLGYAEATDWRGAPESNPCNAA